MVAAYTVAQATAIATPAVVAALCLYARRREIGGDFLLFWAAAHFALSLGFAIVAPAERGPDLRDLPLAWVIGIGAILFCNLALLGGVAELARVRLGPARGLGAILAATAAATAASWLSPAFFLHVALPTGVLALAAAGILLLIVRRSLAYVLAGLVLLVRSGNGVLFLLAVHRSGTLDVPQFTAPLAIFLNFLTGLSLLMIAVDNAWGRLREHLEAARRAKAVSDTILDVAPVSILQKDRDLRVVSANRYAHEISARLAPRHPRILGLRSAELTPDADTEMAEALDRQLLSDPAAGPIEYEASYALADGGRMTMLVRKAALVGDDAEAFGTISVSLDVTHLKQAEEKLRELFESAERANREKTDFLSNMSHELRTPLNGISGFAEMLAADYLGPLTPRQREYVDGIRSSSRAMIGLVEDILDLSRLDAGRLGLAREPVPVAELLASIAAAVGPRALADGIDLHLDVAPATVADADRRALLQALGNLIDNAVRYNRPGGSVWVTAEPRPPGVLIVIRDSGPGMTPEQVAASGDPFLRGDALRARHGGGAGLGLAIARGLIELHGGRLSISSRLGEGTTVSIEL